MLLAERNYMEKRDFIRMYIDAQVVAIDPSNGKTAKGDTRDLSGSGLSFVTDYEPIVGAVLNVTVSTRQSKLPPLHGDLTVIRVLPQGQGQFEIAGELSNIS